MVFCTTIGMYVGISVGAFVLVVLGVLLIVSKFLRKVEPDQALIVTNPLRGKRSVTFFGGVVLPIIHKCEIMDISTKKLMVERRGKDGLICKDNIRADIQVNFYVRVNQTESDVLAVAQSIGCERASKKETLDDLFAAKFSEALKSVGKQMDYAELYNERKIFKERIVKSIGPDLNGYSLEDTAIDYLAQTPLEDMDPNDIMDSEGIKKITDLTSKQAIETNRIQKEKQETITKRNVEARERILELEKQQSEAEAKQMREVENIRSRENAEIKKVDEEERLRAESARLITDEQISIAEENKDRQIAVAQKNKERTIAVETERVEKERALEQTEREKSVALANIEKEKVVEQEKKNIADIIRQRVAVERTVAEEEEKTKDTHAFMTADRDKRVAITAAEREAEEKLVKDIKSAEAKEKAANHIAKEKLILADAELATSEKISDAKKISAEGIIAEESAQGLATVKVKEADAEATKKMGHAEAEAMEAKLFAEAEGSKKKGLAQADVKNADAKATQEMGLAEAKALEAKLSAEAAGIDQKGEAEAKALQLKLSSEASGITEKANAMKLFDEAGKDHEEFKLKIQMQEKIAMEQINISREIAAAQAQVLSAGLGNAHIDIVGGEGKFFDDIIRSISNGKVLNAFVDNSPVISEVKNALLREGDDNLIVRLRKLVEETGITSDTIKNISIAGLINKMTGSAEDDDTLTRINSLKAIVQKTGIGDILAETLLGKLK